MSRKRKRIDANQKAIVDYLRAAGWKVQITSGVGGGFPDLVCARGYDVRLIEVKQPDGALTPDQKRFIVHEGWPVTIVRSVDEALSL